MSTEIQQETKPLPIDLQCKELLATCNNLLNDYGKIGDVGKRDRVFPPVRHLFGLIPKKVRIIDMNIFHSTRQRIQIIQIDGESCVEIVLKAPEEPHLVLSKNGSWIKLPGESGIRRASKRPVDLADLERYEEAIDVARRDLIYR